MSTTLEIKAFSSTESKEFKKHFNAVKFCIDNELSFPKETSEFFRGKVCAGDLEDFVPCRIIEYIKNGIEVPMTITRGDNNDEVVIKVSDIPAGVDVIICKIS